jgi:hypothetical protein
LIHDTATKRAARVASNTSFQAPPARPVSRLAPAMAKVCKSGGEGTFAGTQGNAEVGPLTDPPSLWKQRQGSTRSRWVWKRNHGRASEAPPDERRGNRYVRPTATAPHLDSTGGLHLGLLLQHSSAVCELVHTLSRHRHAYYYTRQTASQVEGRAMSLLVPRVDRKSHQQARLRSA